MTSLIRRDRFPTDPRSVLSGARRIQDLVLAVLESHEDEDHGLPTNNRFVFYELEGMGHVHKPVGSKRRGGVDNPSEQEIIDATSKLRKYGVIPWNWIVDETRSLSDWRYADTVADYLLDIIDVARVNPWQPEIPPLILTESRSLGGVLRVHAAEYLTPIAATNGQVGGFLITVIAPLLARDERKVLWLGDLDDPGYDIERNTRRVLERELGYELDWTRIGLRPDQVVGISPIWKTDGRKKAAVPYEAWECEVLGQTAIIRLVREALETLLPGDSLDTVLEREEEQRAVARPVLEALS